VEFVAVDRNPCLPAGRDWAARRHRYRRMSVIDVGCGTGRHLALAKVGSIESAAIVP